MLVLEALDKASRTIRAMQRTMQGANQASMKGAADAVRANERAAQSFSLIARAQTAAGRAAAAFASASRNVAATAERAWQRVLVVVENYARRQAEVARRGVGQIGAGAKGVGHGLVAGGKVAAGAATGAGVLGAATAVVANQLVKPAAEFEKFGAILKVTEGSSEKAQAALNWVSDFAAKTPYDLAGVTEAFVKMRSYGLDPTNGSMRVLGDTAAAMGKPMMQAVEAMADAVTGENERLKEFGIKASKSGKYFEYAYTDQNGKQRIAKALANDRKAIEKALLGIWDAKYGGAMKEMSSTWIGLTSNLGDAFQRFQLKIMQAGLFDWMKGRLTEILDLIGAMEADGSLQRWATRISSALQKAMSIGWDMAIALGRGLVVLARAAERVATAVGGWENFAYLGIAIAFARPVYYVAAGLFLMARGALAVVLAVARLAILGGAAVALTVFQTALQLTWFAARLSAAGLLGLGRAAILLTTALGRGLVLGVLGLARGLLGLPAAALRAALGMRALAVAAIGLPGRILAAARALTIMMVAGLRALPGLLLGAARGFVAMAVSGLRALPGLLMGAARAVMVMAASGLRALPGLLLSAARGFVMFGASLMATPIGGFIAGAAAIAAAAYLIYTNWDSIGPWLGRQWEAVKKVFSDGWAALTSFDWSSLVPNLDWASLMPSFEWRTLLPSWSWLDIIPSITLPSFDWRSLLPNWDWSSIIPAMPDFKSWFGTASAPAAPAPPAAAPAANPAQLATQAAEAAKQIAGLQPAAQAAVAAASQVLASASFHSHGVALMTTLAAGIRAGAGAAVSAVTDVAQQLRDRLPHSPAKTGPLSDLDKIRFSETLALGIRPGPAVAAVNAVAAGMLAAVTGGSAAWAAPAMSAGIAQTSAPVSAGVPATGAAVASGGSAPGGGVTLHYAPTVTIQGGDTAAAEDFRTQLRAHADEIAKLVEEAMRRQKRKDY
ncbi:tape measure protein [Xanthobacter sp. VTT E-85241]|uniref:tape measure protein n=1 Tax=Roseixanthobacter finlandensis TaxID=3119922 RepID=UPI00372B0458